MPINARALCTTLACGLLLACATPIAQAARLALVIGNDNYEQVSKLRNARADAQTMADALRAVGFEVDLKTDRTQREMLDDVRALRQRIRGGDEVVFFFSGHGVQLGASNHLLPVNVRSQSEDQVRDDALELSRVLADLRSARPAFTLAIVDACRDNPFVGAGKAIGGRGLTGVAGASGQMVIYAAGEGQQALDRLGNADPVRNGLFTRVFARQMRQPGLPVHQVLRNVRGEVARLARSVGHEQVPAIYDQVEGDFFFVASWAVVAPAPVPAPAPSPQPLPAPAPAPAPVAAGPKPGDVIRDCGDCPEMVVIPAGSFMMGSPTNEPVREADEGPQRRVSMGGFAMGKTEVTFAQWEACVAAGGCSHEPGDQGWGRGSRPVINVSWDDAQAYVKWLSGKTGQRYLLPSEAQWEYAARAGTTTPFHTGSTITPAQANFDGTYTYNGSPKGEYRQRTAAAGSFAANAFGLQDMHGNVYEWVQDCYDAKAYDGKAPSDGRAHEVAGCSGRVLRGGSWYYGPRYARAALRTGSTPDLRNFTAGFRLARMLP